MPDGWGRVTISNATSLLRRGTAPLYVEHSDTWAIGQRCIRLDGFHPEESRPHESSSMARAIIPMVGDVLINSTGTGTVGRSAVFDDPNRKYIVDGHVTVARPKPGVITGRWLDDILRSPKGQTYLESNCISGSTNQVELSAFELGKMVISKPPFVEQERIAEILDTLDEQIRLTKATLAKLEAIKSGLAEDLLTGRVRVPVP